MQWRPLSLKASLAFARYRPGINRMDTAQLNGLTNFVWNIADDVLRDVYVRGKYRDVARESAPKQTAGRMQPPSIGSR
jgi:hypothetical protein